jgi:hypothetical protein
LGEGIPAAGFREKTPSTGKRYFFVPSEDTCTWLYPVTPTSYFSFRAALPALEMSVISSMLRTFF